MQHELLGDLWGRQPVNKVASKTDGLLYCQIDLSTLRLSYQQEATYGNNPIIQQRPNLYTETGSSGPRLGTRARIHR